METHYTNERHVQILIYLLKAHGIKRVIASPGTTNLTFVGSLQQDPWFEIYSSVDERSAAYIACGMAEESGEPVVLTCTGATASRNYLPGLTEAYYRKLPVLAVTSMQHPGRVGHNCSQVIDRREQPNDVAKVSVQITCAHTDEDEWSCAAEINKAILALTRDGGGPAHINLQTTYSKDFSVKELAPAKVIRRITYGESFPELKANTVSVFVGSHVKFTDSLTDAVDTFCEKYNGVVLCDVTSNYKGKYRILGQILNAQGGYRPACSTADLAIHIGNVSGVEMQPKAAQIWRVCPDGEVVDTFKKLTYVFDMKEEDFFRHYNEVSSKEAGNGSVYYNSWVNEIEALRSLIPEIPFSGVWISQQSSGRLPENSVLHVGILNSLRSWNYFDIPKSVYSYSNVGGFGIDGDVSALIGASLVHPDKLYFGVIGDLAFFYDMNVLGNRHVGKNIRLMLVNNGRGTEFRNYNHPCARFGEDADAYMAAAGHYGHQSRELVKHYAQDLGFEYLSAGNKEEFMANVDCFFNPEMVDRPILFEVFTDSQDESDAIKAMHEIKMSTDSSFKAKHAAEQAIRGAIGEKGVKTIKKILGK